ncbi:MAG: hypothetical protein JJ896_00125 [Rhodothermales bacterium]|nr:hypothetical protein [Rhodothermales bacterium]MBO6778032.1 hypothetical protein [Rhodothermales bacterium]
MVVLGIDGGGSSTRAVLAGPDGAVLGRGAAGPSNPLSVGREQTATAIHAAVTAAWMTARMDRRQAGAAVLGIAGLLGDEYRGMIHEVSQELSLAAEVRVTHDLHVAHCGGLAGQPGVVLVAGTGSAAYAGDGKREGSIVGGKGALAGDSGSAYWVAHRALRMAVRQLDGRADRTALCDVVLEFLGVRDAEELVVRLYSEQPRAFELARLCPRIVRLAADDAAASGIITAAWQRLADMVRVAASRSALAEPAVVLSGGLARAEGFRAGLQEAIVRAVPGATFPERVLPPVGGAVLDALRLSGVTVTPEIMSRLSREF